MCLGIFVDFLVIGFRNMFALCFERSSEIWSVAIFIRDDFSIIYFF